MTDAEGPSKINCPFRQGKDPSTTADASGKTILDVLKEKPLEPKNAVEKAFVHCDELPPMVDVDVTGAHVEKVARQIKGGAGPGMGLYGAHSEWLRDATAELARRLANTLVEWNDIRTLMPMSHLLALDKCPGVWPIGVGEVLKRIVEVMA